MKYRQYPLLDMNRRWKGVVGPDCECKDQLVPTENARRPQAETATHRAAFSSDENSEPRPRFASSIGPRFPASMHRAWHSPSLAVLVHYARLPGCRACMQITRQPNDSRIPIQKSSTGNSTRSYARQAYGLEAEAAGSRPAATDAARR